MVSVDDPVVKLAYSAKELAKRLGVSLRHIRRMDACGALPEPVRLGRCTRWSAAEIGDWINAGCPDRVTWKQTKGASR